MLNVKNRKCRTEGCGKLPSFGAAGTKTVEYCAQHAPEGMVDVRSKKCRTEGCGKLPSFAVTGTRTGEYCSYRVMNVRRSYLRIRFNTTWTNHVRACGEV